MIHYLVYDGQSSLEYGVHISGTETFDAPERDITALSIPGRNGDLIFDNGRYKNIDVTYPAFIHRNFARNAQAMRAWLMKSPGYKRLEDTYLPILPSSLIAEIKKPLAAAQLQIPGRVLPGAAMGHIPRFQDMLNNDIISCKRA